MTGIEQYAAASVSADYLYNNVASSASSVSREAAAVQRYRLSDMQQLIIQAVCRHIYTVCVYQIAVCCHCTIAESQLCMRISSALSAAAVDRLVISRALAQALLSDGTATTPCCTHTPAVALTVHTGNSSSTLVAVVPSAATCSITSSSSISSSTSSTASSQLKISQQQYPSNQQQLWQLLRLCPAKLKHSRLLCASLQLRSMPAALEGAPPASLCR
eukprot:14786-Heterococcus_DN1.PRE.3